MDHRTQAFRAASHLPSVSICLLLAAASLLLLCSRTESSGDPKASAESRTTTASEVARSEGIAETPAVSQEELRIWTWLHQAETLRNASRSEEALGILRRAEALADDAGATPDIRGAIQRGLAESLDAAGRHEQAVEIWWRLLSVSAQHDDVARGLASSLYASGRPEEARRVYREILHVEMDPPDPEPGI